MPTGAARLRATTALLLCLAVPWTVHASANWIHSHQDISDLAVEERPWQSHRLPRTIAPVEYTLRPYAWDAASSTFDGRINMDMTVVSATNRIIFHARDLGLEAHITVRNNAQPENELPVRRVLSMKAYEMFCVELEDSLPAGTNISMFFFYEGKVQKDKAVGLFATEFTVGNETRAMLSTNLMPTFARSVFPCFDEPEFKARFKLEMNAWVGPGTALSTNPQRLNTRAMSPHRFGFAIGNFRETSRRVSQGPMIGMHFLRHHEASQANFALDTVVDLVNFYNDYLHGRDREGRRQRWDYPLSQLDILAIPHPLLGDSVTSLGLITVQDSLVLCDQATATEDQKARITLVLAQAVAEQWFGGIVALRWWDDLWLEQGLAAYLSYLGARHQGHGFDMARHYSNIRERVMYEGAWESSKPLTRNVTTPEEIKQAVCDVSKYKGALVFKQLELAPTGDDNVKEHLWSVLSHGYAEPDALQSSGILGPFLSHDNNPGLIASTWRNWYNLPGYPVVKVTDNYSDLQIHLAQRRSLWRDVTENFTDLDGDHWVIPYTYISFANQTSSRLLVIPADRNVTFRDDDLSNVFRRRWIKANVGGLGLYRVNYNISVWWQLGYQLRDDHSVFSFTDRKNLLDDAFALARTGELDPRVPYRLSEYLPGESDVDVWRVALTHLRYVLDRLKLEEEYRLHEAFIWTRVHPKLDQIGWLPSDGDQDTDRQLRIMLLQFAKKNESFAEMLRTSFSAWLANETTDIHPDLFDDMLTTAMVRESKATWAMVLARAMAKQMGSSTQRSLLVSLAGSRDMKSLKSLLKKCLNTPDLRRHYFVDVLTAVGLNTNGQLVAWDFVRHYWDTIVEKVDFQSHHNKDIFEFFRDFEEQFDYDEIQTFFRGKNVGLAQTTLDRALEQTLANIRWRKHRMPDVKYLLKYKMRSWATCEDSYYPFSVQL